MSLPLRLFTLVALLVLGLSIVWQTRTDPVPTTSGPAEPPAPQAVPLPHFVEIVGGCGPVVDETCVVARTKPETTAPIALRLRKGMVLKVDDTGTSTEGWHTIVFNEWLRYPGRVADRWYVEASSSVRVFENVASEEFPEDGIYTGTKRIVVDRSNQTITAYAGEEIFMEEHISTGLLLTPTPLGTFMVYRKTPARYMQGPLPGISDQYYDLPGVPWNLYFTRQGGVIHGAYWHESFGQPWSHGCVNLSPSNARKLYEWADIGTPVFVKE